MHGHRLTGIAYDPVPFGAKTAIFFDDSREQSGSDSETQGEDQRGFYWYLQ